MYPRIQIHITRLGADVRHTMYVMQRASLFREEYVLERFDPVCVG